LLTGGDRRSVAQSARALDIVRADRTRVADLVALTQDDDWLVSMRATDLIDKLAHEYPEWVEPYRRILIGPLADSDKWEIRLQVVRALPLFKWTAPERRRAVAILLRDVDHPQTFVKAWALDGLAAFAEDDPALLPLVRRRLRQFERSGSKALAARAKHIRARLRASPRPTTRGSRAVS
jgi:hypothetical protein